MCTVATRDISCGAEVLLTYGEGYWLARAGHPGRGADIERVGSSAATEAPGGKPNDTLQQALAASRQPKQKKGASKRKKAARAESAPKPPARGFG